MNCQILYNIDDDTLFKWLGVFIIILTDRE